MSVREVCSRVVATVGPDESVRNAARRMAEHEVGTLVVTQGESTPEPFGIVTDRDITLRCIATSRDPDTTAVREVMTSPVQSIDEFTPLGEALSRMGSSAIRRLVVTSAGTRLIGILSLDDVLEHLVKEAGSVGRLLEKQQPHVGRLPARPEMAAR